MKPSMSDLSERMGMVTFEEVYRNVAHQFFDQCLRLDEKAQVVRVLLDGVAEGRRFFLDQIEKGEMQVLSAPDIDGIVSKVLDLVDLPAEKVPKDVLAKLRVVTRLADGRGAPGNSEDLAS
ncbi:MAG: hypothetical protein GX442_09255 [Candidatus Riflebacteria bacterium]|nr:hypothetical protein [Candidatus Riflebacteria bacterium]